MTSFRAELRTQSPITLTSEEISFELLDTFPNYFTPILGGIVIPSALIDTTLIVIVAGKSRFTKVLSMPVDRIAATVAAVG